MSASRETMARDGSEWARFSVDYGFYSALMSGSIDGTDTRAHDRGVIRAMSTQYKPNKHVTGDPERTLFVARLSHNTSEDVLKEVFTKYGKIEKCRLVRDIVTGRSKGYGFVEFKHLRDAEDAYDRTNKMYLDGSQIVVEFECSRTLPGWVPRRFGGGFGGKKESGQLRFGGRERPFRKPIVLGSKVLHGSQRDGGRERPLRERDRDDRLSWSGRGESWHRHRDRDRESERERERERRASARDTDSKHNRHGDSKRQSRRSRTRSRSRST